MIKVMVVEDEPPIAKSIKNLVEKYKEEIKVIHIAINGKRALEKLMEESFDIVFSDIKMPVMDGIELCKNINELYPNIITYIISGFQDFEYARLAIKYGVSGYLLKPIDPDALYEALDNTIIQIKKRKKDSLREYLINVLNNEKNAKEYEEKMFGAFLICAGSFPYTADDGMLPGHMLYEMVDLELDLSSIINEYEDFFCITGKSVHEKIVVLDVDNIERVKIIVSEVFQRLILNEDKISVNICIYDKLISLYKIGEAFKAMRRCLREKMPLFRSAILNVYDKDEIKKQVSYISYKNNLILALKKRNLKELGECTKQLVYSFVDSSAKQSEFVMHIEKLFLNYFDGILSLAKIEELKNSMLFAISNSILADEFSNELFQILKDAIQPENTFEKQRVDNLCEQLGAYIRENYNKNISNTDIARHFGMSAIRLSKQFKDYFGMTILEYLSEFRIEMAKIMMKEDKNAMIKEIAASVGFNDQYYFSKTFKKLTGVWPSQYLK